jgi:hypothetical protein
MSQCAALKGAHESLDSPASWRRRLGELRRVVVPVNRLAGGLLNHDGWQESRRLAAGNDWRQAFPIIERAADGRDRRRLTRDGQGRNALGAILISCATGRRPSPSGGDAPETRGLDV